MLESTIITFTLTALVLTTVGTYGSYRGWLSRHVEMLAFAGAMIFWGAVAAGAWGVQVPDPAGGGFLTNEEPGLAMLGLGGTLYSLALLLLTALDTLPDVSLGNTVEGGGLNGR